MLLVLADYEIIKQTPKCSLIKLLLCIFQGILDQVAIIQPEGVKNSVIARGLEVKSFLKTACFSFKENSNSLLINFSKGFVVAISPFNFTAIGGNLATGPAILGNVVLWKPALTTTRAAWMVYEILEEAGVPPGTDTVVFYNSNHVLLDVLLRELCYTIKISKYFLKSHFQKKYVKNSD